MSMWVSGQDGLSQRKREGMGVDPMHVFQLGGERHPQMLFRGSSTEQSIIKFSRPLLTKIEFNLMKVHETGVKLMMSSPA